MVLLIIEQKKTLVDLPESQLAIIFIKRGFRMGNTCIPVADSCRYMAKPIQYCKVKK